MAKINWQDIGELTAVDADSVKKAIVIPAKEALRQVRFALTGNLTIRDNQYAAIVTLGYTGNSTQTLTSGTEYTFQNPLKTEPIGFTPIQMTNTVGVCQPLPQFTFNTGRTDGLLGVTARFDMQDTRPWISLRKSGSQSLTSGNTATGITWQTLVDQDPAATISTGIIYVNSTTASRIQVTEPGRYLFNLVVGIQSNTTGFRGAWLLKNGAAIGAGTRPGESLVPAINNDIALHCSAIFSITAGEYVEGFGYQNSGGNLNLIGNANEECWMQVTRLWNNATPTGILSGILWGG